MYNKSQMHLDAWYKSLAFAIMITISINTRGFGAFLTKYVYDKYIYIYYVIAYIRIFVQNAPNSWKLMQVILSVHEVAKFAAPIVAVDSQLWTMVDPIIWPLPPLYWTVHQRIVTYRKTLEGLKFFTCYLEPSVCWNIFC